MSGHRAPREWSNAKSHAVEGKCGDYEVLRRAISHSFTYLLFSYFLISSEAAVTFAAIHTTAKRSWMDYNQIR